MKNKISNIKHQGDKRFAICDLREGGFTLLELLVVLMIMSMVIGMSIPAFSSYVKGARLRSAAREISSAIMSARTEAITLRKDRTVQFRDTERDFGIVKEVEVIGGVETWTLPPGVKFNIFPTDGVKLTPVGRVDPPQNHVIRIFSDENNNGSRETDEPQKTITVGALGHVTIK